MSASANDGQSPTQAAGRPTLDQVVRELSRRNFAVLSTVGADENPHSAGVNYGLWRSGGELAIFIMTRRHLLKARQIGENPRVSLVVPIPRRLLWFLPPATIQLHGRAEILDSTDLHAIQVFQSFWMGRQILTSYAASARRGEKRICFIKITPDPVINTYIVGYNVVEERRRMESGAGRVILPTRN